MDPELLESLYHKYPNCSCQDISSMTGNYAIYNFFIVIIALPIIAVFGLISNSFNIYIFSRPMLAQYSGNIYLIALAVSDFCVVFTGIFLIWMDSARTYLKLLEQWLVDALPVLTIGQMATSCSIYFTIFAAFDCCVHVCWPQFANFWCSRRRAIQVIIGISICSIAYNVIRFWQFEVHRCVDRQGDVVREVCGTELYEETALVYNLYMYMIAMVFFPFFILAFLNLLIIRKARSLPDNDSDNTITMVMVVVMFLLCNTLPLIVTIVEQFVNGVTSIQINYCRISKISKHTK